VTSWVRGSSGALLRQARKKSPESVNIGSGDSQTQIIQSSNSDTLIATEDNEPKKGAIEHERAHKLLEVGRSRLAEGEYADAEALLRQALTKLQELDPKDVSEHNAIILDIANACFDQNKLVEVRRLCTPLVEELPHEDAERLGLLAASHLLAQVYYCMGSLDMAMQQCKQTLKDREDHDDKVHFPLYNESLVLLLLICDRKGDKLQATAYASLLPASPHAFTPPIFKGPIPPSQRVDTTPSLDDHRATPFTSSLPLTPDALRSLQSLPERAAPPTYRQDAFRSASAQALRPEESASVVQSVAKMPEPGHSDKYSQHFPVGVTCETQRLRTTRWQGDSVVAASIKIASGNSLQGSLRREVSAEWHNTSQKPSTGRDRTPLPPIAKPARIPRTLTEAQKDEALRILAANDIDATLKPFNPGDILLWAAEWGHDLVARLMLQGWTHEVKKKKLGITV